jgi:hypothetical protein
LKKINKHQQKGLIELDSHANYFKVTEENQKLKEENKKLVEKNLKIDHSVQMMKLSTTNTKRREIQR